MSDNDRPLGVKHGVQGEVTGKTETSSNFALSHSYSKVSKAQKHGKKVIVMAQKNQVDVHTCSACQLHFTSLEDYLSHKQSVHMSQPSRALGRNLAQSALKSASVSQTLMKVGVHDGRDESYTVSIDPDHKSQENPAINKPDKQAAVMGVTHIPHHVLYNMYKCSTCLAMYQDVSDLQKHIAQCHNISVADISEQSIESSVVPDLSDKANADGNTGDVDEIIKSPFSDFIIKKPASHGASSPSSIQNVELLNISESDDRDDSSMIAVQVKNDSEKERIVNSLAISESSDVIKVTRTNLHKIKCNICGKYLKDLNTYKAHLLTHDHARNFKCKWEGCTYAFKTKGSLKRHMRRHTDERPYRCELCGRSFREGGTLTRHLKSRTSCLGKTDADLPKYKKKLGFDQNIPAAMGSGSVPGQTKAVDLIELNISAERDEKQEDKTVKEENESTEAVQIKVEHVEAAQQETMVSVPAAVDVPEALSNKVLAEGYNLRKMVTVVNSKTGERTHLAVPLTTQIIPPVKKAPTATVPGTPKIVTVINARTGEKMELVIPATENLSSVLQSSGSSIVENNSQNKEKETEEAENIKPRIVHIAIEKAEVENTNSNIQRSESQNISSNTSIKADLSFERPNKSSATLQQIETDVQLKDDLTDSFEESFVETITVNTDNAGLGNPDGMDSETEDTYMEGELSQEELGLSMEEVETYGEGVDSVVQCTQKGDDLEIDEQQGVPLTNRKKCMVCSEHFSDEEALKSHLKMHLIPAGYKCPVETCRFVAPKKPDLYLHMQILHQGQFSTELDDGTEMQDTRREGNSSEDQEPTVDTEAANIALRQLLELQGNLDTQVMLEAHKKPVKVLHGCPVCHRKFTLNYLKLHVRAHTGEKPFSCNACEKKFRTKDTLTKHMSSHSDTRNYKCGECGKMFKRISHAREHLKVHSQERPYSCTLCDKSFKSANGCKVHLRTHTGYMPYQCRVCQKSFREKSGLDRHNRIHTGEKPFKCIHCGRGFAEHGTLSRHYKAKVPCTDSMKKFYNLKHLPESVQNSITMGTMKEQSSDKQKDISREILSSTEMQKSEQVEQIQEMELQIIGTIPENAETVESDLTNYTRCKDTADYVALIGTSDGSHQFVEGQNNHNRVLEEFSTVVTDTQQYIIGQEPQQMGLG